MPYLGCCTGQMAAPHHRPGGHDSPGPVVAEVSVVMCGSSRYLENSRIGS